METYFLWFGLTGPLLFCSSIWLTCSCAGERWWNLNYESLKPVLSKCFSDESIFVEIQIAPLLSPFWWTCAPVPQFSICRIPRSREVHQSWSSSVISTLNALRYSLPLVFKLRPDMVSGPRDQSVTVLAQQYTSVPLQTHTDTHTLLIEYYMGHSIRSQSFSDLM